MSTPLLTMVSKRGLRLLVWARDTPAGVSLVARTGRGEGVSPCGRERGEGEGAGCDLQGVVESQKHTFCVMLTNCTVLWAETGAVT